MHGRPFVVALIALIAIAAVLPSGTYYHCRMDGTLHMACCCDTTIHPAQPGLVCSPSHKPCCDLFILPPHPDQQSAAIPTVIDQGHSFLALLTVIVPEMVLDHFGDIVGVRERYARPPDRCSSQPPCYMRFCSYLI